MARAASVAKAVGGWHFAADVADSTAVAKMFQAVAARHGRLDVLVNNAGVSPLYPSLSALSEELWDKVIAVNVKGPFRLAALAAEHMAREGGGSIINVSSVEFAPAVNAQRDARFWRASTATERSRDEPGSTDPGTRRCRPDQPARRIPGYRTRRSDGAGGAGGG
jgi:NAD(P)-dependent dehydrogenase (short-subunit alcohol dehydrogenase family)